MTSEPLRRPIEARNSRWAAAAAHRLAQLGVRPNTISLASLVFAAMAGACFAATGVASGLAPRIALWIGAAAGIQLRLLCNLLDGMVAIEENRKTPSGAIFNELPDRFADAFILVGAGFSAPTFAIADDLGWLAAVLAVTTAYVRALGGSVEAGQIFAGPMAKQNRMALMTAAAIVAIFAAAQGWSQAVIVGTLALIIVGCVVTIVRRCRRIIAALEGA